VGSGQVHFHQLDVTDDGSIERLAMFVQETYGTCATLVNNAAVANRAKDPFTPNSVQRLIDNNCFAPLKLTRRFLPLMARDGRVVMVLPTLSCRPCYRFLLRGLVLLRNDRFAVMHLRSVLSSAAHTFTAALLSILSLSPISAHPHHPFINR
jgi:hypothetical protein